MNEREYAKLRKQIEAEYFQKLGALDMVYAMSGGSSTGRSSAGAPRNDFRKPAVGKGELARAVRDAVDFQTGIFTVRDVENRIIESRPELGPTINRASLSSALKRLAKDSYIITHELGRGKRATKYAKRASGARETGLLTPCDSESTPTNLAHTQPNG